VPTVRGLEQEYGERIEFVRVNVLDASSAPLMRQLGFSTTPELYLVDTSGRIVRFWDGDVSAEELRGAFDTILK
jgi:hypothetical protein